MISFHSMFSTLSYTQYPILCTMRAALFRSGEAQQGVVVYGVGVHHRLLSDKDVRASSPVQYSLFNPHRRTHQVILCRRGTRYPCAGLIITTAILSIWSISMIYYSFIIWKMAGIHSTACCRAAHCTTDNFAFTRQFPRHFHPADVSSSINYL